jgi:branched-chain amino acid transport system permease protein
VLDGDSPTPKRVADELGNDEWVAQQPSRLAPKRGLERAAAHVPFAAWIGMFAALAALIPVMTSNDYVIRVGFNTLLYVLLALGLNVVVGWAGLLDLGYFASFGFGAYLYAIFSSSHFGLHWPAEATIPLVLVFTAALGLVLSLPSRRLTGDYLAIVTLFFGEIFLTLATNANRITVPFIGHEVDFTGGPNGIVDIDNLRLFELEVSSVTGYFYFALVTSGIVALTLHLVNESRTGRAWRALREDELAAELMGTPTAWLKMLAFAVGAAVAGLTGTIFAALNTGVFPSDFGLPLLITIYVMIMLGGIGSQSGVIVGAILVNVLLELLRTPDHARWVFYGGLAVALIVKIRPWARLALLVASTVLFGYAVRAITAVTWSSWTHDGSALQSWLIHPSESSHLANWAYLALILAVLAMLRLRGLRRDAVAVVALYLAVYEWETVLVEQPSVTRVILLGAVLVTLIVARPQGLLGQPRVETV